MNPRITKRRISFLGDLPAEVMNALADQRYDPAVLAERDELSMDPTAFTFKAFFPYYLLKNKKF